MDSERNQQERGRLENFIKDEKMRSILKTKGIKELFPIQYETFGIIYEGKDIVAKDRTGSGKTLAFAIPVITRLREEKKFSNQHSTKFLIVLPTRELAIQVTEEIKSLQFSEGSDFTVGAVYGGQNMYEQKKMIARGLDIIVGTPGRMIDFLDKGVIRLHSIEVTCLDEADEMLKQGFKEQIERIFVHVRSSKKKTQNLLFSATIPEWIWEISNQYQSPDCKFIDLMKDQSVRTSKTVQHYCVPCTNGNEKQLFIAPLIKYFPGVETGKVIIFCETKRDVDRVGNSQYLPMKAHCLHGDICQIQRESTFKKFKKGEINCIVATNVAARGLDFPQIDLIIQMQPPKTTEEYIHRSGRTGRAGKSGICVTLFTMMDEYLMERIEYEAKVRFNFINEGKLKNYIDYGKSYNSQNQGRGFQHQQKYPRNNGYGGRNNYVVPENYGRESYQKSSRQEQSGRRDNYYSQQESRGLERNQYDSYESSRGKQKQFSSGKNNDEMDY